MLASTAYGGAGGGRPDQRPACPAPLGLFPTREEARFLDLLNAARADPPGYGRRVGIDLSKVRPAPPLIWDFRLVSAARCHSRGMSRGRYFDHADPGVQIAAAGYAWSAFGQSIAAGFDTPAAALVGLVRDAGFPGLEHRRHLLGIGREFAGHAAVGVGVWHGGEYGVYYTVNTATAARRVARRPALPASL